MILIDQCEIECKMRCRELHDIPSKEYDKCVEDCLFFCAEEGE